MKRRVAVRGAWVEFETEFTDAEAIAALSEVPGQFARDLIRHNGEGRLSAKQWDWVHKLANDAGNPGPEERPLEAVRGLIDRAFDAGLQYPKINLETIEGLPVRLSRAGDRSRAPGVIHVTDGKPFGENQFYGSINLDGVWRPTRNTPPEVLGFLLAFNADPEAVATAYGLRSGNCCFCARVLTDGRSVGVGYGPICADKFGLPWGEIRAESTVTVAVSDEDPGHFPDEGYNRAQDRHDYDAELDF